MLFQKSLLVYLIFHAFGNFVSLTLIIQGNQGGLMQEEGSTLQEVQQNDGLIIASAASTARGIPRTGGCKDPVQLVNVPSENFTQRPDRTEEKKGKYI